ncbi:acyl-CoA N-acyltransferase [Mycena galopus ATCC 62051]|nr:acyl-CoA N-acyltransferase [Mycena galopus ATCC 62051]
MASDDVQIRPYRASDFPQVRALLFEGFVTGKGSVATVNARAFLYKAPMIGGYFLAICGAILLYYLPHWDNLPGGVSIGLVASAFLIFFAIRRAIINGAIQFCEKILETDMKDISAHYAAPGAFFVAVQPAKSDKKNDEAEKGEDVLGFVGLEYKGDKKIHTAELRRMVVGSKYRRRGIAKRLVLAAIEHAESVRGLDSIELGTNEYQRGAKRLFESLDWEFKKTDLQRTGFGAATVFRLSRAVETKKRR